MKLTAKAYRRIEGLCMLGAAALPGASLSLLVPGINEGLSFKTVTGALLALGAFGCCAIGYRAAMAAIEIELKALATPAELSEETARA